jgi:hypothetical protein
VARVCLTQHSCRRKQHYYESTQQGRGALPCLGVPRTLSQVPRGRWCECVWKEGCVEEAKFLLQSSPGPSRFFLLRRRWWTCPEQNWSGLSLVLLCAVTVWALIGFWSTFHHACKGFLKARFTMCFDFNNSRILDFQETVYLTCLGK